MKGEEIKIRISPNLKKDFQDICENEETTMSNKINDYIVKEVKLKKIKEFSGQVLIKKFIHFGKMDTNGRLYQKSDFTKIRLDDNGDEYTELDRINNNTFYGQYGHPNDDVIVHKYNATHLVKSFKIEDDYLIGEVTILNPSIVPILDKIVFRPRSYGYLDDKGVVKDLDIIGFDAILITDDKIKEE